VVHRSIHDRFVDALRGRVASLVLGSGLDDATDVGPVINDRAVERIAAYAVVGREEAELVIGGEPARDGKLAKGSFFQPTIFAEVRPTARIAQEEIFGPVTSVIPVDDWEAAVRVVNDVKYGLSTSLFTQNINLAFRSIRDFDSGLGYVNHGTIGAEAHLPFGGVKATGNGHREVGQAALDFFSEWKSVYIDYSGKLQRAQIDMTFVDQE
jgi:aldehyde dehydrogenase (NAD+)